MKRLISMHVEGFTGNDCFLEENRYHKHMPTDGYRALRDAFKAHGYELNTSDVNSGLPVCAEIHVEGRPLPQESTVPRFLLAYENPIINTLNASVEYYKNFDQVFTWNPAMLPAGNVQILMVPQKFISRPVKTFEQRTTLLALINANKAFQQDIQGDLYKARLELIRYCEANCPQHFHLYGRGWDKPTPSYRRGAKLKRSWIRFKTKAFGYKPFPSYRGEVSDKDTVYQNTRFAVCYENFAGLNHYITEKIFDAFFSGCVPVYWGAPDVTEFIPPETFIDRRQFGSDAELVQFLGSMTETAYSDYQRAIDQYLKSDRAKLFDLTLHAKEVARECVGRLG